MKDGKTILLIIAISGLAFLLYMYWKAGNTAPASLEIDPALPPPLPPQGNTPAAPVVNVADQNPVLYDTDSGQGGAAVLARMKSIWNNAQSRETVISRSGLINRIYQGLSFPDGIKNAMAGIFGSSSNIPLAPDTLETGYSRKVKEWKTVPGFETLTSSNGGDPTEAFSTWKNALYLQQEGLNFWPPNIEALIEAKQFGQIANGDRNRSERYDAFTKDMKVLGENIAYANGKLDEIVRDQAINDLRGAGWQFIGYDLIAQNV